MEIKEVESLLGISRSKIRFYEKEGLIFRREVRTIIVAIPMLM